MPAYANGVFPQTGRLLAALGVAALGVVGASAYQTQSAPLWSATQTVALQIQLGPLRNGPLIDGSGSWNEPVVSALEEWNQCVGRTIFTPVRDSTAATGKLNGRNDVFFSDTAYGEAWPGRTFAYCFFWWSGSRRVEADVLFKSASNWNSYRGPQRGATFDLRRVALHELGHALGLDHPDDAGQSVTAIMNSTSGDLDQLASDDRAGIAALYQTSSVSFSTQPQSRSVAPGANVTLTASATGSSTPTYRWQRNGVEIAGASSASLALTNVQPSSTGLYTVVATVGAKSVASAPAVVGVATVAKVTGSGAEASSNVPHPNGNVYDQILLTGAAATVTAEYHATQMTRTSFVDLDGDIVQVELSGPGALSIVLEGASGPAIAERYNQPKVSYLKGHAGLVITGADERTNLSVFCVGRRTAFDPGGRFNPAQSVSASNNPETTSNEIFLGHPTADYDGWADIAYIAILSTNGRFGGVRAANATFFADRGFTGIYAPEIQFTGPVFIGDIVAFDTAKPVIRLGSALGATGVTGGDMAQANNQAIEVSGITRLEFRNGEDAHGRPAAAQTNRGRFLQSGADVTAQIVAGP